LQPVNSYVLGSQLFQILAVPEIGQTYSELWIPGMYARWDEVTAGSIVHGNMRDPNPWSYHIYRFVGWRAEKLVSERVGAAWYDTQRFTGWCSGSSSQFNNTSWSYTDVYDLALTRLLEQVRGGLDLAVSLAEIGSTFRMLSRAATLLNPRNYLRVAGGLFSPKRRVKGGRHKGDSLSGLGGTRDIANGYLEWKYGWKPMMQDVYDAADEALRFVLNRVKRFEARGTKSLGFDSPVDQVIANIPCKVSYKGTRRVSCTISVEMEVPQDLSRWTSYNPISIGWELVPYSFVVDWVFDIGSYLRNVESALLYHSLFRSGYVSYLYVSDVKASCSYADYSPSSSIRFQLLGASGAFLQRDFRRDKLIQFPFPNPPKLKVDLGSSQLLSAASLLRQRLRF